MEKENKQKLGKAIVFGGTGAVGQNLVKILAECDKWSEVMVVGRRGLPEWDKYDKSKLKIVNVESLDQLNDKGKWDFKGYDATFCCLGGHDPMSKMFKKVSYDFVLAASQIAQRDKVNHFSFITSMSSNKDSYIGALRIRGQIEEKVQELQYPKLSIYRPGVLLERPSKRWQEYILTNIPFIPKVSVKTIASKMKQEAELFMNKPLTKNSTPQVCKFENSDILAKQFNLQKCCEDNQFFK